MLNIACLNIATMTEHEFEGLLPYISEERRLFISNCRDTKTKYIRAASEALMRLMIAEKTGISATEIIIEKNEHGKPYQRQLPQIHFNWSHSHDYVMCAVADYEIGIDIQKIVKLRKNLAEHILSENEKLTFDADKPDNDEKLIYYWCKKESYYKYIGTGIDRKPSGTDTVALQDDGVCEWVEGRLKEQYVYSVCAKSFAGDIDNIDIKCYTLKELVGGLKSADR